MQKLRGMTPRAALTKHLLDGDDSTFTGKFDEPKPKSAPQPIPQPAGEQPQQPITTPFDSDAT